MKTYDLILRLKECMGRQKTLRSDAFAVNPDIFIDGGIPADCSKNTADLHLGFRSGAWLELV